MPPTNAPSTPKTTVSHGSVAAAGYPRIRKPATRPITIQTAKPIMKSKHPPYSFLRAQDTHDLCASQVQIASIRGQSAVCRGRRIGGRRPFGAWCRNPERHEQCQKDEDSTDVERRAVTQALECVAGPQRTQ